MHQLIFLSRLTPPLSSIPCSEQLFPRDRSQDISSNDQCAIVLRYIVRERAKKRQVCLVNVDNSSEKCLDTLLQNSIAEIGLILQQCIGDSFDRAAILSSIYSGLAALMKATCPNYIHIWCYAHSDGFSRSY